MNPGPGKRKTFKGPNPQRGKKGRGGLLVAPPLKVDLLVLRREMRIGESRILNGGERHVRKVGGWQRNLNQGALGKGKAGKGPGQSC